MDGNGEVSDPRFTLTAFEREEVTHLKHACDEEGIPYTSIFELAKYCLVSSSIKNAEKRREDSLNRLRKRHQFEQKHGLVEMDLMKCVEELEENMPGWAISCGQIQGKWCVGYTSETANPSYMQNAFKTICKVEMSRFDLAASDLEEARRGFFIVGTGKGLKANPFRCMRVAINLRVLFDRMHANRVKGIYYEVPQAIAMISSLFLAVVPSKIKDRITLGNSLKDMSLVKTNKDEYKKNVPDKLGGEYCQSLKDWFSERLAHRRQAEELVTL